MDRIIKFLPWLNIGMNVIAFFPFTLHIIITDGGAFGFGYLALPFTVFINIGGILAMFQIVRKSSRRSYAIINGIFGVAGMLLLFLVLVEWWTAVLEKVSTMVDLLRRTVDEIILDIAVAHGLTSIRVAQYLTIALYTHWIILHRTDAVWI